MRVLAVGSLELVKGSEITNIGDLLGARGQRP
jgi:hypothetical protein